jgi:GTP-binding protein
LLGSHRAIVTDIKGTTKEIFREKATIDEDKKIMLLDSPGLEEEQEIEKIKKIIDEADIILFVVDGKQGLTPQDSNIAKYIFEK